MLLRFWYMNALFYPTINAIKIRVYIKISPKRRNRRFQLSLRSHSNSSTVFIREDCQRLDVCAIIKQLLAIYTLIKFDLPPAYHPSVVVPEEDPVSLFPYSKFSDAFCFRNSNWLRLGRMINRFNLQLNQFFYCVRTI